MQKFKLIGKPLLGEKYVEGKKKEEKKRIMPSLVATHYVRPCMQNVPAHAVRSYQNIEYVDRRIMTF